MRNQDDIHEQPVGEIIDARELKSDISKGCFVYRWFYVIYAITAQDSDLCKTSYAN